MESSSSSGSSSGTAANNDSAPFGGLYGDLLGAILFSIMLPFVTFKAVDAIMMDNAMAMSILDDNEHAATHIPHYRIELHTCAGGSVALCSGITSYFSYHIINDAKRIDNSKSKLYTRSAMMERLAQQWSYISFSALILSMIGLAVNNWPHVDEQTLPGHFVWNLVVATANLPHSYRTKAVMGAINLVTGLAIVILYPNIYPVETFAPILVVITGTKNGWL
jgi:hypothetical protein